MKNYIFIFTIFFSQVFIAQNEPLFTWISGSKTINQAANYGVKGLTSASNFPGARENSMSWIDQNNNLWLFGGNGNNASTNQGLLNDLWKYDISLNQWTWMSGIDTFNSAGVYGTKGVANANNVPRARQNAVTWVDNTGNLWLFGGQKSGSNNFLNDLWKYTVATNQWTWMSGSNTVNQISNYGAQNVASSNNIPGARFGSCAWKSSTNELWLFGGQQFTSATERVNDLWKFDITLNEWTWVSGSSVSDQNGVYGTKGVMNANNVPGARQASCSWVDDSGNFWMFGGYGFPGSGAHSYLNDLWKFDFANKQWTWISGSNTINQGAVYGTKGVSSSSNLPGARQMSIPWKDNANNFYLFGGWGYVGPTFGRLNDFWKYDITSSQWTWAAGANSADAFGVYGTQGNSSSSSIPGARRMSISWTDNSGKFWFFGGNGYDELDSLGLMNDLWQIDLNQSNKLAEFTEDEIKIYPNPSSGKLMIEFSDELNHQIQLMDEMGNLLLEENKSISTHLNLAFLSRGVYFLKIDGEFTRKFVRF